MGFTPDTIKQTLLGLISSQAAVSEKYTTIQNAFTRTRKITFSDAMLATISLQKDHSKNELLNYFSFSESSPTLSALIQQRSKISPTAFESLFYSFSGAFDFKRTLKGYELLAIDGSDIYLPRNPNNPETYRISDKYGIGFNMLHLNATYNLCTQLYTDVRIQSFNQINEYNSMCSMIDGYARSNPDKKAIFIADRGFCSFNVMAHAIENKQFFLIRARDDKHSLFSTLEVPSVAEFDIVFERILTRQNTKEIKEHPKIYKSIGNGTFDYIPLKSQEQYSISFRVIRLKLSNGKTEVLYTNLPADQFSLEDLRELYHLRWGIETSFRDLKYNIGLRYFHSRKQELILQEIYAKLIAYNFCRLVAEAASVGKQKNEKRKYCYKINFTILVKICFEFLKCSADQMINVGGLLQKNLIPIRPNRNSPRYLGARTAASFEYR